MTLTYTLMFAVAFALLNLWLALRISQVRHSAKVGIGDGGNLLLQARMRAQANFVEYVPLALILIGLVEYRTGSSRLLFALGIALVVGRVLHPFGLERSGGPYRAIGMLLTWGVTLALIVWGALILYGVAH